MFPGRAIWEFRRDGLGFLTRVAREHGDAVEMRAGGERFLFVNHPDLIHDVLVVQHADFTKGRALEQARDFLGQGLLTSEGDVHLRQRRLIQPGFHRQYVASHGKAMVEAAAQARDGWRDGEERDLHHDLLELTLAIGTRCLFDTPLQGEGDVASRAFSQAMETFPFFALPFSRLLFRLPLPPVRRYWKARARLDATVRRLIDERRATAASRHDVLSMLIGLQHEDGTGMSDEQLRDEVMTLFLAGHETIANGLAWTFYLLACHPEVDARAQAEIRAVVGDGLPTAEHAQRLEYLESVFAESMRLYPPVWAFGRRAVRDCEVGGYRVRARTIVFGCQWVMHRDPRFHPDPLRFDPARSTREARASRPRYSYFPFGGGPRQCIGEGFAWLEGVLVLATLLQRYKIHLRPKPAVEPWPLLTLRPRHGLPVRLERRA
jgi:cytochrome P450